MARVGCPTFAYRIRTEPTMEHIMETSAEPRPKQYKIGKRTFTILFPDLLRPLNKNERQPLKNSIRKNGVVTPVVIDEDYGVIDGANRVEIAAELGLANIPVVVEQMLNDERKLELALSLNDARRQLTPKDRREAQANLEKERAVRIARVAEARKQGKSLRAIAEKEGVSHPQIIRDLKEAGGTGVPPEPTAKVAGRDGKEYAARRTKPPAVAFPEPPSLESECQDSTRPPSPGHWDENEETVKMNVDRNFVAAGPKAVQQKAKEIVNPPKPPPPPPTYPHSVRLMRFLGMIIGEMHLIKEQGGIGKLLADREKWDWPAVRNAVLPMMHEMRLNLAIFEEEIKKHVSQQG